PASLALRGTGRLARLSALAPERPAAAASGGPGAAPGAALGAGRPTVPSCHSPATRGPAPRFGRACIRAVRPERRPPGTVGLPGPPAAADLLQPPLRLLHPDGSRSGGAAHRRDRRPPRAPGDHHRGRRGEPEAGRGARDPLPGAPAERSR